MGPSRPWPLLTGKRGHYELAAGNDARPLLQTMEYFSGSINLLPEQIWSGPDLPGTFLRCGGPSGSANPLLWAHSEYVRLLRSCHDGKFLIKFPKWLLATERPSRTASTNFGCLSNPIPQAKKGHTLRICAPEPFQLRWTSDNWSTRQDSDSRPTGIGGEYFDVAASEFDPHVELTFFWKDRQQWEGQNYQVQAR